MLRVMQDEVADLTIELIARYQPVATDLRFIRSCMEIAYGFSRYGRYSFDIVEVLETIGSVSECEKGAVLMMANTVRGNDTSQHQWITSEGQNHRRKTL